MCRSRCIDRSRLPEARKLSESHEVREAIRSFAVSRSFYLHLQGLHELVFMKPVTNMRSNKIIKTTIKMVKAMKKVLFLESNMPVFAKSKRGR